MKEQYIKIDEILDYCKQSAENNKALANRCINGTGKGESETSMLGGAAYFLEQARMYEYDIPNVIKNMTVTTFGSDEDILSQPIEILDLSLRTYHILIRSDKRIKTIGDITNLYKHELMKIRNMGRKSAQEIEYALIEKNLKLRGE
jgi:hypothetical protein